MTISLRLNDEEASLIRKFAELNGLSISELLRQSVLERIEEEYDLKAYEKAIAAFQEDPVTFTLDEVERELGLL
ncbi:MAG: ribbon-helix-helix protein, CopG family [Clostridia bacterium]|nr:ribbon-helix-helix protein, CopG family [Clostridia bacterium]MBQ4606808.1 ribbon-helix-helix protein, CopG family [Clostridia bacterium]